MRTRAKLLYYSLSDVMGSSVEQTVEAFSRDVYPGDDIVRWEEMAAAYLQFTRDGDLTLAARREVFRALLAFSVGVMNEGEAKSYEHLSVKDLAEIGRALRDIPSEPVRDDWGVAG